MDGQAAALVADALGQAPEPDPPAPGRRGRALVRAEEVLLETVAQKVLHGWLQNRHQTLFPLTVNLRGLEPERAAVLPGMMAVALLAGLPPDAARREAAADWLRSVGATPELCAAFEAALAAPPPLSQVLVRVQAASLAPHAYVVALVALDAHDLAGHFFLEYLAARLNLPATVVRSANRRYRR